MFTKPFHAKFFSAGQVIETHRGKGIFQPAVDQAIKLLQDGEWVSATPALDGSIVMCILLTRVIRFTSSQKAE
jgi:hypothetical protein